jgi:multidrug resistance efflux pump
VQSEQVAVYQVSHEQAKLNLDRTNIRLSFNVRVANDAVEATQYAQIGQSVGGHRQYGNSRN